MSDDKAKKISESLGTSRDLLCSLMNEIKSLEGTVQTQENNKIENMLKDILTLVTITSKLSVEFEEKELVQSILDVALMFTDTDAGSILLIDEEREELYFSVVKGSKAEKLKDFRLPLGKGIAGNVALTGQPICVSNVKDSDFFDPTISEAIDYSTRSILAVPLEVGEKVIGVLEVINKEGDKFSKKDIEILLMLGKQAAMAISGNRMSNMIYKIFLDIINRAMEEKAYDEQNRNLLLSYFKEAIEQMEQSEDYRNIMEMTSLLVQISKFGPLKQEACIQSLRNFKGYIEKEFEKDPFSLGGYSID